VVVRVACQHGRARDFRGFSPDSGRDLARLVAGRGDVSTRSPAPVHRMLAAMVLKPHRVRYWLTRTAPECARQREERLTLSLPPPRHSRLRCLDETTGRHALARRYPTVPMRPGQIERRAFEYLRHGVVALCAAFDGHTGQVFAQCDKHHRHGEFRHFLRGLRARDPDRRWHLMLDHASDQTTPEVLEWCAAPRPRITLHWLPDHGSWRNHVDSWCASRSRQCRRRARRGSTREWRDVIHRFLDTWNAPFAPPFQWTDTGKPLAVSHHQCDLAAA
jgi:hypothetical protein